MLWCVARRAPSHASPQLPNCFVVHRVQDVVAASVTHRWAFLAYEAMSLLWLAVLLSKLAPETVPAEEDVVGRLLPRPWFAVVAWVLVCFAEVIGTLLFTSSRVPYLLLIWVCVWWCVPMTSAVHFITCAVPVVDLGVRLVVKFGLSPRVIPVVFVWSTVHGLALTKPQQRKAHLFSKVLALHKFTAPAPPAVPAPMPVRAAVPMRPVEAAPAEPVQAEAVLQPIAAIPVTIVVVCDGYQPEDIVGAVVVREDPPPCSLQIITFVIICFVVLTGVRSPRSR